MRRLLVTLLLVAVLVAGCARDGPAPVVTPSTVTGTTPTPSTVPTSPTSVVPFEPSFDGARALGLVEAQVRAPDGSTRTRVAGSAGNEEIALWIADSLTASGFEASWHHFTATYGCEQVAMHNIVGERVGSSGRVVVVAAHYDTRPIADKDPDPAQRDKPIAGAIDGASGVAVLLELARVAPLTDDTLRFVFFDGEDGGGYLGPRCTDWILGSRAYAASLSSEELASIRAFVLVDMVGDPKMVIPREGQSDRHLLDEVFGTAKRLGHAQFLDQPGVSILDDHVPFVEKGVPSIDLIHTIPGDARVFPAWHHTHADDLDAVSAESLAAVGRTLEAWLAASGK